MKLKSFIIYLYCFCMLSLIGIAKINAAETSPRFIQGIDTLIVYKDVPGLTPSDKYTIRVRSAATNNEWVDVFAHYTYNRALEIPDINQTNGSNSSTSVQHYPNATAGWSHTYGNIEMSRNQPVEVEISLKPGVKIDGQDIYKATVHPVQKASAALVIGGKVYFTLRNPVQVAIDINGQMDDHNPFTPNSTPIAPPTDGVSSYTVPLHTITMFTNPIMKKPSLNGSRVKYIEPGTDSTAMRVITNQTTSTTYDTLYFKPGVHNIGMGQKIYPGKAVYIPGDAIVYGSLNNWGVPLGYYSKIGERIKIFGYGTISGAKQTHPYYVPNPVDINHKTIAIDNPLNYQIIGITVANPANFSVYTPSGAGGFLSYVKVIGWRANGDGLGNGDNVNDCFVRTNDDESYVRGNRKRVTYWKDNISAIFYMSQIWETTPILIEDCDVLYCRARGGGGAAWDMRADAPLGQRPAQVTFRNIRFHDPISNMTIFNLITYQGNAASPTQVGGNYNWIKFENISIKTSSVKSNLLGCAAAPWNGGVIFDNVSFAGTTLTQANFSTYFNTNEYVNNIAFGTPVNYNITLNVNGAGGTVSGGGTFNPSYTATIAAKSTSGYIFDKWTEGATIVSTDSIYSFNVLANRTLTANFISFSGATYTITTSANLSNTGTITGSGVHREGQFISVTATANSCYDFVNWTDNGTIISTTPSYSFNVNGNKSLQANFSAKNFTVAVLNTAGGIVTGNTTYTCNQTINVTATPNTGYKFDGWYADNTLISKNLTESINTGNAIQIKAKFSLINSNNVTELTGWVSGTTNDKVVGNNRLMVVMAMGESTGDFSATGVNYGGQAMTKIIEKLYYEGTASRTYASIFVLKENGINAATSGAIDVTWDTTPSAGFSIYSVLLGDVDQTTPVSASANNALAGTSIITTALAAESGDMIILCGATANNNVATTDNGFTKQFESNSVWGDGVGGNKLGSGVNETPKFSQSGTGRMVLCAMVVKRKIITGMNDVADIKFNIYPNPATDRLFYNSNNTQVDKIELLDLSGRAVYIAKVQNQNGSIDLTGIKAGLYLIKFYTDHSVYSKKVVIK